MVHKFSVYYLFLAYYKQSAAYEVYILNIVL